MYDDFLAKLKERFAKLVPGDPMDPQTTLAPMNSKRAKEKLQDQVDRAIAGANLKKSSMELGGSDAFVVLADADIDEAVNLAWRVRLYNAGQVCTSSKRFIVAADVYDDFLAKLKERFAKLVPGDPMDPQTTLAPMNSKRAKEKLQDQVDRAIAGAEIEKQATGVLMLVEPWNFPYYQIMRVFAPNY
ncbi:hypothetical protein WP50_14490, partial [Lactiplantibacillus plantarum]